MSIPTIMRGVFGAFLVSLLLLIGSWSIPSVGAAADQLVKGTMILAPTEALDVMAANSVEDTLKACLARIPEVATDGQRLLAEQSCQGEEGMRKAMQVAPGF